MYAYDTGSSRRHRDVPPSSSNRYRDTGLYDYAQPARSSRRYKDVEPSAPSSHDRHRRRSVPANNVDEVRHSRRANVVASDDGRGSRDIYGSAYPERSSKHDAEAKTSDRNRQFREQRRGYETDEAENLRRAKSYSPRRAAREAEVPRNASPQAPSKSAWAKDDKYAAADPYRSSSTKKGARGQQYYEEDPYAARRAPREHATAGKDYVYGSSPAGMPRPPAGDYTVHKSSPLSSAGDADEKLPKHSRESRGREKPGHHSSAAYPEYETYEPPRRTRSARVPDSKKPAAYDDYGYAAAGPPPRSSRDRPPPTTRDNYEAADPYDRASRSRQRQSVPPPQARSRYPDMDDNYGAPPRRATSMNHGSRYADDYDVPSESRKAYRGDDRASPVGGGAARTNVGGATAGAGGAAGASRTSNSNKQKKWGKQAGKLFMTHAVPVIKQEAVPFLTKAAQAYMEGKKR